jgi:hypothetical protein
LHSATAEEAHAYLTGSAAEEKDQLDDSQAGSAEKGQEQPDNGHASTEQKDNGSAGSAAEGQKQQEAETASAGAQTFGASDLRLASLRRGLPAKMV